MFTRNRMIAGLAVVLLAGASTAFADALSSVAFDNATVQAAGPRAGANGKNFFNVEGSGSGSFASFGVADFGFGAQPFTVTSLNSIQLVLTQSNAAFSTSGPFTLSLDHSATLANIQPGTSPLIDDGADPGTATDVALSYLALFNFGGGPFMDVIGSSGEMDTYALVPDASTAAEIVSRLNAGKTIRIVVGSGASNVAATWAGFSNSTFVGPKLLLDVTYDKSTPTRAESWGRIKASYR